ncbi:hypothetical protein ACFY2M_23725 [Streptomyces sp. NPDC001276]|uniref:hypothetical protein n=1 Tax=Streptomyces sp. NPDC001276 TaxID=3364555 RepID=UPI0036A010D4
MANPTTFDFALRLVAYPDCDSGGPTRVASCGVSGIGILGSGVIPREGGGVRGTGGAVAATGLRPRRDDRETTAVRAAASLAGDQARGLERLVARPALECGVRDLRRHPDDAPLGAERKAVAA